MTPSALRVIAAILIVGSAVLLFTSENSKVFALLLIAGSLLSLAANFREKRS